MLALKYNTEIKTGKILLNRPNNTAPVSFDMINSSNDIGASRSLSKERDFFSNVMVTASIEVVPKRTDIPIIPGKISLISKDLVLKNIIKIQAKGKMIPQLMLGGLR